MNNKKSLGVIGIILFSVSAVVMDLITLIPAVGSFFGWLYFLLVGIAFWLKGYGFINAKRLAPTALSIVAELIPAIQALPTITAAMIAMLVMIKTEDKLGISLDPLHKKPGVTMSRNQKIPMNSTPGVRPPKKTSGKGTLL